jgi:F-type H+-transporting ATPase subunit a
MFRFAADDLHITITSEKLFSIGGFNITNSMFYGWICSLLIIGLLLAARKRLRIGGTKGLPDAVEAITEYLVTTFENSFGNRKMAVKYSPIFITMFFFILLSNWLGLLPGVGHTIVYNETALFRPFTADLNGTLAMAVFGMLVVQIIALKEAGIRGYGKHFFPGKLVNPATYLIGAFEIFSEFTRLATLGLRLFLNIAVGEILIAVIASLAGPAGPIAALPFYMLELFVGLLQAYIFVVLCAAYLSLAVSHQGDHGEAHA